MSCLSVVLLYIFLQIKTCNLQNLGVSLEDDEIESLLCEVLLLSLNIEFTISTWQII
jgi:hypothetical protein